MALQNLFKPFDLSTYSFHFRIECFLLLNLKIIVTVHIQVQIYPQTSIVTKYDAFHSNNEVREHTLSLVL